VLVRHRFGSPLNLHVHAQVLLLAGSCKENIDGTLCFVQARMPTQAEVERVANASVSGGACSSSAVGSMCMKR
jgi:hypothetical protein